MLSIPEMQFCQGRLAQNPGDISLFIGSALEQMQGQHIQVLQMLSALAVLRSPVHLVSSDIHTTSHNHSALQSLSHSSDVHTLACG